MKKEQRRVSLSWCARLPLDSSSPQSLSLYPKRKQHFIAFKRGIPQASIERERERSFQFVEFFMFLCRHKHLYYISLPCWDFVWSWLSSSPLAYTQHNQLRALNMNYLWLQTWYTNPHNLYTTRWDDANNNGVEKRERETKGRKIRKMSQAIK